MEANIISGCKCAQEIRPWSILFHWNSPKTFTLHPCPIIDTMHRTVVAQWDIMVGENTVHQMEQDDLNCGFPVERQPL